MYNDYYCMLFVLNSTVALAFILSEIWPCNKVTEKSNWMLILTSTLGLMALHPLQRMQWKIFWKKTPSRRHKHVHFRVEMSRLPGEKENLLWQRRTQTSKLAISRLQLNALITRSLCHSTNKSVNAVLLASLTQIYTNLFVWDRKPQ